LNSSFIKKMYSNLSYEEMKQSIAKVEIFYDELKETIISQEIKTSLADLISNIGGILGLFLGNIFIYLFFCFYLKYFYFKHKKGMSFLSLIEFIEILFNALSDIFKVRVSVKIALNK
jgi:hypothetical protein